MNIKALLGGVIGFLLGGLVVSIAAQSEGDCDKPPTDASSIHSSLRTGDSLHAGLPPVNDRPR